MEILPRIMIKVLKDLLLTIAYLDDIIIYSKTAEEHLDHLQQVFHKLCNAELSMKMRDLYSSYCKNGNYYHLNHPSVVNYTRKLEEE